MKSSLARFWSKVDKKSDSECWNWTAAKNRSGYGQIRVKGKLWIAHRFIYSKTYCSIPEGKVIMHICDNPSCVNPKHLLLGTLAENNKDRARKNRSANTNGIFNPNAVLTEDIVFKIREMSSNMNVTYRELERIFNLSSGQAYLIVNRKTWKHI